jgi:hypothetical protein
MTAIPPVLTLADIQRFRELIEAQPAIKAYAFVMSPGTARRGIELGALPAELNPDNPKPQSFDGIFYIVQAKIPGWSP